MGFGRRRQTKPRSRVAGSMAKGKGKAMKSSSSRPMKKPSASAPKPKAKSKHTPRDSKSKPKPHPKQSKQSKSKRKAEEIPAPECSAMVALDSVPKVPLEGKKRRELAQEYRSLAKTMQRRPGALRRPSACAGDAGEELERMRIESERKAEQDMRREECNSMRSFIQDMAAEDGDRQDQEETERSSSPSAEAGSGSDSDLSSSSDVSSKTAGRGAAAKLEETGDGHGAASALNMKDVDEDEGVWSRPHQGESQAASGAAAATCPAGTEALAESDMKVPDDMFLTAHRMAGKLKSRYGLQAVHNLLSNLNNSTLVTLYSGLGGAELAFEQAHLACMASVCQGDQTEEHAEQPQQTQTQTGPRPNYLFACECDPECIKVLETHEAMPKVVPNILSFVQQWAVNRMDAVVTRLKQDVDKVLKKAKKKEKTSASKSKSKSKTAAAAENEKEADQPDPEMKKQVRQLGLEALREIVGILDKREAFKEKIVDVNGKTVVTLNELLVLAEGLVMWCGSVCKDWSPMSSQSGFSGKWMPLFGVMIGLVRLLKPRCFFHENSSKFDSSVFQELLKDLGFQLHHEILDPRDFGMPVRRPRAWDCILRKDVGLIKELYELQNFKSPVVLDAGAFALASDEEVAAVKRRMAMTAMQGISEPFSNLLPPGAMSNLTKYRALAADLLGRHLEVACNLDQNPECMPHWGRQMPVVLASTTNMWLLKQNRPLTAKELLASQGVPIYERLWRLAGFTAPPVNVSAVKESAVRRMAGNSFNQAVAISFLMFIMANLRPVEPP